MVSSRVDVGKHRDRRIEEDKRKKKKRKRGGESKSKVVQVVASFSQQTHSVSSLRLNRV